MKIFILLNVMMVSGVSLSAHATPAAPIDAPTTLKCNGVQFVSGLTNFSDISGYFPMSVNVSDAVLSNSATGITTVDFSDGDQYSFYRFATGDLSKLRAGTVTKIDGTYEDGFDWSNGYNTRAKFTVRCTK